MAERPVRVGPSVAHPEASPGWHNWSDFAFMAISRRREHPSHQVVSDELVRLGAGNTLAVLDVGVLSTVTLETLRSVGFDTSRYVGLDLSFPIVCDARSRHPTHPWVQGTVERLPFADGAFDVVVLRHVLEHLPSPDTALAELARVARIGALVCFFLPPAKSEDLRTDVYDNGFIHHNTWQRGAVEATMRSHFGDVSSQMIPDQHRPNELYRLFKSSPSKGRPTESEEQQ